MKQYLKPITLLAFSIFVITFISCDNEPLDSGLTERNDNTNAFIGDWEIVTFETETATEITFMGQTTTSDTEIDGLDMDYIVTFTENTFTTAGDYSMHLILTLNGMEMQNLIQSYNNVSGSGYYSTDGNILTTDGSFFEFEFQGVDTSEYSGPQTIQFAFSNGGQTLTTLQQQEISENQGGIETTTIVNSITVLNKL